MEKFDKWKNKYTKNWCTREQLQELVKLQVLTPDEYDIIVNSSEKE